MKLAPFKFPFTRTSKSRSNDEKDKDKEPGSKMEKDKRREKEGVKEGDAEQQDGVKEKAREDEEDNAKGQSVQLPMSQLQLTSETDSNLKSPIFDSKSPMVRNEQAIRSSPPPSYEHVIEQVKI